MDERVRTCEGAGHVGNLSKPRLYELLSRAALMVYPAFFDETCCIAAIEAQACGTPVVATDRAALPQTLAPDAAVLVGADPRWVERFADRVVELLYDPERRMQMGAAGKDRARQHGEDVVAAQWEELFCRSLEARAGERRGSVRRTLSRRGDLDAAGDVRASELPGPAHAGWPGLQGELWAALKRHLPASGRVVVVGDGEVAQRLSVETGLELEVRTALCEGRGADVVLDVGGLLQAGDRAAFLGWCSDVAQRGRVVHVLPEAALAVPGQRVYPAYDDIVQWFGEKAGLEYTIESAVSWGVPARCWIVEYEAGEAAAGADRIERKRVVTRPVPTVSVCMIVRDVADTVLTTLRSVVEIADEIRIVDTGSVDSTLEVIAGFTQRVAVPVHVRQEAWVDDFSASRNQSVEGASGDWVLWIDADERLIGGERLRRLLQTEHFEAYAIRQHNHIFDRGTTNVELPFRVFRNGRGYRFFGAIHEHPERALNETIEPWMIADGVDILHYGYLTEPGRRRKLLERNLALLNRDLELYPGRTLTEVLYLRDCVNLCRFDLARAERPRADHLASLEEAVRRFEESFFPERGRYYHLGRQYYDRGLEILGQGHEIVVQVGGKDARRLVHRFRRADDALFLATMAAQQHVQQVLGGRI